VLVLYRALLAAAKEKTNGPPDQTLQDEFETLSNNVDELQQDTLRLRAEAEGIACANPRVVSFSCTTLKIILLLS